MNIVPSNDVVTVDEQGVLYLHYEDRRPKRLDHQLYSRNPFIFCDYNRVMPLEFDLSGTPGAAEVAYALHKSSSVFYKFKDQVYVIYARCRIWIMQPTIRSFSLIPAKYAHYFDFAHEFVVSITGTIIIAYQRDNNAIMYMMNYRSNNPTYRLVTIPRHCSIVFVNAKFVTLDLMIYDTITKYNYARNLSFNPNSIPDPWSKHPANTQYAVALVLICTFDDDGTLQFAAPLSYHNDLFDIGVEE